MRLWQRVLGAQQPAPAQRASLSDLVEMFKFDGNAYPFIQQTMGGIDREKAVTTAAYAYRSNSPVFALTLARMQVFSQIRFQWTRFSGGQPGKLFGSPELAVLERPWVGGTTADLLARMELDVSLAGNAYVRRTSPTQLNRLRPDWVTIVIGSREDAATPAEAADAEVVGYLYQPPSGRMITLTPNQLAHYAPIPDPDFNYLGMSWVTPAMREVHADAMATEHKGRFFQNAATPNLAIKFDPSISLEQMKAFKEVVEADHTGAWNAYRTLYLGGGADPVVVGKDFRELDFAATQGKGESRLASDAGVPPSWVGFSEGLQGSALNAGNFNSARRRFSDGTMVHLWSNVAASLEPILTPPGQGASLWYDTAAVAFMREDASDAAKVQAEQASTITALVREGFTPESVKAAVMAQDWSQLEHTGLTSVQLVPPSDGQEPLAGLGALPAGSVTTTTTTAGANGTASSNGTSNGNGNANTGGGNP